MPIRSLSAPLGMSRGRQTGVMRVYLPATLADLAADSLTSSRPAHALTAALRAALPGEDDEGLELSAFLAAADASAALVGERGDAPYRVVVSAEVDAAAPAEKALLPSEVVLVGEVRWSEVVSVHVDAPETAQDVALAAAGDSDALDRAAEADLLWHDVSELALLRVLAEELRAAHRSRPVPGVTRPAT